MNADQPPAGAPPPAEAMALDARMTALAQSIDRLTAAGRNDAAAALCVRWIAADPANARPHHRLARFAAARGDWPDALRHIDAALARAPRTPRYLIERGVVLRRTGDLDGSAAILAEAVGLVPHDAEAHGHLGLTLLGLEQMSAAKERLERAHAMAPGERAWQLGLARIAGREEDAARAVALLDPILAEHPDDVLALELRAQMALDLGDLDGAIDWLTRAASADPAAHEVAGQLVLTLLKAGRVEEGWTQLRRRLDVPGRDGRADLFPQSFWPGGSVRGRTLALWRQFGVGDEILLAGMLPDLIAEGGRAVVECDRRLVDLFARSFPTLRFVAFRGALAVPPPEMLDPAIDHKAALADLGGRYRGRLDRFPARAAYLRPDPARRAALAERYRAGRRRPVIGITWHSEGAPTSRRKSVPIAAWGPIFRAIDATWVDLQYGQPADRPDLARHELGASLLRDPGIDPHDDLDGLAAQIAALDLVVTISTTTAHLAGAVGTPTVVMVPAWRGLLWHWFTDRPDSPWYPRVRLFRQARDGDWSGPIAAVASVLRDWRPADSAPS